MLTAPSWLFLALASAAFLGLYDVSKKASVNDNAVLPTLFLGTLAGAVAIVPIGIVSSMHPELAGAHALNLPPLTASEHLLVALKALLVTSSWVCGFLALKLLPLSLAAPVRASSPLFTLVGAVLLFAERPSAQQWAGIAIILVAYWIFSSIGKAEGFEFRRSRAVGLLFAGLLLGAASGLYDKHLLAQQQIDPLALQLWFTIDSAALQGLLVLLFWWPQRRLHPFEFRWTIPAVGLLLLAADAVYFRALAQPGALIGVVSIVRRSNVLVSFSLGSLVFGERYLRRKAGALAFVLLGLTLLLL